MDTVIEVEIDAGPTAGTYSVHVLRSLSGGEPSATITLDIDDVLASLPQIESTILASSVSARRVMSGRESSVQSIGVRLFDAVFTGRIGEAYRASSAVANERGQTPQMTLRLTAPELAALPWETLYDSEGGRYVSRKEPLVRRVSSPFSARVTQIQAPLRILGMVSSPRGLQVLDVEAEKERLESALAEHLAEGRVELVWLDDTSWSGLHSKLLRETWHVLHFVGHGGYDEEADEGLIALVGRDGRAEFVSASSLADLLNEAGSAPRLVVLNSCQSGATGTSDLFAGTAATLVHSGINAVVAMQFAVSDYAALAFARSFYVALASGRRIDEAVRSGRIGILGITRDTLEWITPVLYLGTDDTRLLDPSVTPPNRSLDPIPPLVDPARPAQEAPELPTATVTAGPAPAASSTPAPIEAAEDATPIAPAPADAAPEELAPTVAEDSMIVEPGSATDRPPPANPPSPTAEDGSDLPRGTSSRRPLLIAAIVAVVILVGGGVAWGLGLLNRSPSSESSTLETPSPAPTASDPTIAAEPPVEFDVLGNASWQATGVRCAVGDELSIAADGTVLHTQDLSIPGVSPDGIVNPEWVQFNLEGLAGAPHAGLIGSLDQQQEFFFVGSERVYQCPRAGELFLTVNDVGVQNNGGSFHTTITKTAASEE